MSNLQTTRTQSATQDSSAAARHWSLFKRLEKQTENYCRLLHRKCSMVELSQLLCMRAIFLHPDTARRELQACRHLIAVVEEYQAQLDPPYVRALDLVTIIDDGFKAPYWMVNVWWHDFSAFREIIGRLENPAQMKERGMEILDVEHWNIKDRYLYDTVRQVGSLLATDGRFRWKLPRSPQTGWKPISRSALNNMLDQIGEGDPVEGLLSVARPRRDYAGLTRLLATSAWLSGMRSIEMFSCRVVWTDASSHQPEADGVPLGAAQASGDVAAPGPQFERPHRASIEAGLKLLRENPAGLTPCLLIRGAKTASRAKGIDNRLRSQVLDAIPTEDLECLWLTSQLRKFLLSPNQMTRITSQCSKRIGNASQMTDPPSIGRVTLHTLRHAFVDAARSASSEEHAAALSGHTSTATLRRYGKKGRHSGGNRPEHRWLPQPDPRKKELIARVWNSRNNLPKAPEPVPSASVEIVDPAPGADTP